jgi:hypothetical protein
MFIKQKRQHSSSWFQSNTTYLMFCWPCITVYQYNKTNVMHLSFNWLCHNCSFIVIVAQPTDITRTQYTKCRLCSASWGWASDVWNMHRLLILNKLNEKCITLVSLYWQHVSVNWPSSGHVYKTYKQVYAVQIASMHPILSFVKMAWWWSIDWNIIKIKIK